MYLCSMVSILSLSTINRLNFEIVPTWIFLVFLSILNYIIKHHISQNVKLYADMH
jgi:hypothetical protein